VAFSSYQWVKTWRAHWIKLGNCLNDRARVEVSSRFFDSKERRGIHHLAYGDEQKFWKHYERFSWIVRPALATCYRPLIFIVGGLSF
jgi:hypothetical protein